MPFGLGKVADTQRIVNTIPVSTYPVLLHTEIPFKEAQPWHN